MKDGGRLSAAIEVLAAFSREHRPLTEILKDWGNTHRFAGSGDRGAIGNLVHDALRRRASLSWKMETDTPRALALGVYAIVWNKGIDRLEAELEADRHAPEPLSAAERAARGSIGACAARRDGCRCDDQRAAWRSGRADWRRSPPPRP